MRHRGSLPVKGGPPVRHEKRGGCTPIPLPWAGPAPEQHSPLPRSHTPTAVIRDGNRFQRFCQPLPTVFPTAADTPRWGVTPLPPSPSSPFLGPRAGHFWGEPPPPQKLKGGR